MTHIFEVAKDIEEGLKKSPNANRSEWMQFISNVSLYESLYKEYQNATTTKDKIQALTKVSDILNKLTTLIPQLRLLTDPAMGADIKTNINAILKLVAEELDNDTKEIQRLKNQL